MHSWAEHHIEVSVQLHDPAALPPVPVGLEVMWLPESSGRCGERSVYISREENTNISVVQSLARSLYSLSYPGSPRECKETLSFHSARRFTTTPEKATVSSFLWLKEVDIRIRNTMLSATRLANGFHRCAQLTNEPATSAPLPLFSHPS